MKSLSSLVRNANIGHIALFQSVINTLHSLGYESAGISNTAKDGQGKHVRIVGDIKGDYVSLYGYLNDNHKLRDAKTLANIIAKSLGVKVEETRAKDYIIDYQRQLRVTICIRNEDDWTPTVIIFGPVALITSIDTLLK